MTEDASAELYLRKALESLAGAESECANRAYYAAFQAAISALLREHIRSRTGGQWPHAFVQGEFAGKLINRNRRYPSPLRSTLPDLQTLRSRAGYHPDAISEIEAHRGLRRSREFVEAIRSEEGSP